MYSFLKFVDLLPRLSGFFSLSVLWNMSFFHISVWWNHIYSYIYVVWDNPRNSVWLQMDRIATKCDFPKYHCEGWPWHFKSNKDIITKFKWHGFQVIRINRKKFGGHGTAPSSFPTLMNLAIFGHFSQYRAKG